MEFDLFDDICDEYDDDLIKCMIVDSTQISTDADADREPTLAEFECTGEDSSKSQFSSEGFITNPMINLNRNSEAIRLENIQLTSHRFCSDDLLSPAILRSTFAETMTNIKYLKAKMKGAIVCYDNLTFYECRKQITQLYYVVYYTFEIDEWTFLYPHMNKLRNFLNSLIDDECLKSIYFANSNKGRECNVVTYHFLHGSLEWKLLDLFILAKYESDFTIFKSQLKHVVDDLLKCHLYHFKHKIPTDLISHSPFPCTCFKEFWLVLQLTLPKWMEQFDRVGNEDLQFWSIFNNGMLLIKENIRKYSLTLLNYAEFSNWLLRGMVRLYGYDSNGNFKGSSLYKRCNSDETYNYTFAENITQIFLNAEPSEENLRIFICILSPIILEWWEPKANIPMLLWEHFHKRLNSSFYVDGAALSNLAIVCNSGRAYLDKYKGLLERQQCDINLSSYTQFTLLLGKTMHSLLRTQQTHHAQQLLGRIYAKFSLPKFLALNETGIHHLIELFLILLLNGDIINLLDKLRDKLLSIALDKVPSVRQTAVTKGHMAIMILYAKNNRDLKEYITKLLQQLAQINYDQDVSKIIADSLLDIYQYSNHFQYGEHLLIDAWLPNYLTKCTSSQQDRSLEALHLVFEKFTLHTYVNTEIMSLILKSLNTHILPFVKQQYLNNFSTWLPQLAANFCLTNNIESINFYKLYAYFAESTPANRQASVEFILKLMNKIDIRKLTNDGLTIVIQVWLKSLILLRPINEAVIKLTRFITTLPIYHDLTNDTDNDLIMAKEPLCVFIAAIGKQYDAMNNDYSKRCKLADQFNGYLRNFDKWLRVDVNNETNDVLFRFYSFIAIVIYNCPFIVYTKSKINCFFHVAITRYFLTTNIQMGKQPDTKISQLVHKVWPILVQGIGRLNFKADPYLTKTLTDLIQKWTPHFKITTNTKTIARPFIRVILQSGNEELTLFIYEKLTSLFLATQRRQASDSNACFVITIYQEILSVITNETTITWTDSEKYLETFMKGTCLLTLEHIIMVDEIVPTHNLLLDLFKRLTHANTFKNSIRLNELIVEHLKILTKKHLAFYTFFYFELLMKLSKISYQIIENIWDYLIAEILIVEVKRGGGEDKRIRSCLKKLKDSIDTAKREHF